MHLVFVRDFLALKRTGVYTGKMAFVHKILNENVRRFIIMQRKLISEGGKI